MINVGVRQQHTINGLRRDGKWRPVAHAQCLQPLEQPAVHQKAPPTGREQHL
jgi:hypothetical protein